MRDIYGEPPDFVGETGVKWWEEHALTSRAVKLGLTKAKVWTVAHPDGGRTYLLTEDNVILAAEQGLEAIGIKVDLMAYLDKLVGG